MIARLALVVLAVSLLAFVACEDSPQEITFSPTEVPPPTDTPQPTYPPPPTPRADLESRLEECAGVMEDGADPAGTFRQCIEDLPYQLPSYVKSVSGRVTRADGTVPLVLIDMPWGICQSQTFVAWQQGDAWQVQSTDTTLRDLLVTSWPGQSFDSGTWTSLPPRLIDDAGQLYLGVIIGHADCGSGPHQGYVLLSLREGSWTVAWNAKAAFAGLIGQTGVAFSGEGLDTIAVRGTSYGRSDAKSSILTEHKLAPVRSFDQSWVRQGDAYVLARERIRASGSNTLLEFIYRLGLGDDAGVLALVTDPPLVATARTLGLLRDPEDVAWAWYCTDEEGRALGPFVGWPCILQRPDGSAFRFTFVESGANWLIAAIDSCTPANDGLGARCL